MTDFKQHSISSSLSGDFSITEISCMSSEYYTENVLIHTESAEAEEETNFFAIEEKRLNSLRTNCEKRISILDDDVENRPTTYFYETSDEIFGSPRQKNSFDTKMSTNEEEKAQIISKTRVLNDGGNCEFSFSEDLPAEPADPAALENLKKVGAKLIALAHRKWCNKEIFQKWFLMWKDKVILYKTQGKAQVLETLITSKEFKEKTSLESLQLEEIEANFKLLEDEEKNNLCRRIFIKMCECVGEVYTESFKTWRENMINRRKYVRDRLPEENEIKETQKEIRQGKMISYEAEKKKIEVINRLFLLKNKIRHKQESTKMNYMLEELESVKRQGSQALKKFEEIHRNYYTSNKSIFNNLLEKSLTTEKYSMSNEAKIKITQDNIKYFKDTNKKQFLVKKLIESHDYQYALYIKSEQNNKSFNTPLLIKEPASFTSKKSTFYTSSYKDSNLNSIRKNIFSSNKKNPKAEIAEPKRLVYESSDDIYNKTQNFPVLILTVLTFLLFYLIYTFSEVHKIT
ncbi:unnamed protein product [Blepharisma stoltei]|uniref:Uncharacterized protein n=1 Tax=Blepharisma stoltei TaxID=1481888 RepID=A0AAU9KGY4_9CILI|nr:unnamed protein product [Blepharisma stoltei]